MKNITKLTVFGIMLLFVVGCATLNIGSVPWHEKTPVEKAAFFLKLYNKQFDDLKYTIQNRELTVEQKTVLKERVRILTDMRPLIDTYAFYVDTGAIPPPDGSLEELERRILALFNILEQEVIDHG